MKDGTQDQAREGGAFARALDAPAGPRGPRAGRYPAAAILLLAAALLLPAPRASALGVPPGTPTGSAVPASSVAAVPPSAYQPLDSGDQLMFLYHAQTGAKVDHGLLAEPLSKEYRSTRDAFARRELLESLRPRIEQGLQQAARTSHVRMDIDATWDLGDYDFERKGFPLKTFRSEGVRYFSDNSRHRLVLRNSEPYAFLPVADEALARKIEALRSKHADLTLRTYLLITGTDPVRENVETAITRVELLDPSRTTLLSLEAPIAPPAPAPAAAPSSSAPRPQIPYGVY